MYGRDSMVSFLSSLRNKLFIVCVELLYESLLLDEPLFSRFLQVLNNREALIHVCIYR